MSPYYGYFVLQAMDATGHQPDGIALIRRYWGDMLRRGATTWWEKFDPSWTDNFNQILDKMNYLSLSHGWSTGPTSFLTETVLGVKPTGAGYDTVDIHPHLGDLSWAEGDIPTPKGLIHVRLEGGNGLPTATVTIPNGVVADIRLGNQSLKENSAGTYRVTGS